VLNCSSKLDHKHLFVLNSPPVAQSMPCQLSMSSCAAAMNSSLVLVLGLPINKLTSSMNALRSCFTVRVGLGAFIVQLCDCSVYAFDMLSVPITHLLLVLPVPWTIPCHSVSAVLVL